MPSNGTAKLGDMTNNVPPTTPEPEEEYHEALTRDTNVRVAFLPGKGKAMVTKKALAKDAIVLSEDSLITAQELDDRVKRVPICQHTMMSFETPEEVFHRIATNEALPDMPKVERFKRKEMVEPTKCRRGCSMLFASDEVKQEAEQQWHAPLCRGKMDAGQKASLQAFEEGDWTTGGIDYSDSFHLVLRATATILCSMRFRNESLEKAWQPFMVLAWGGWIDLATEWTERRTRTTPKSLLSKLHGTLEGIYTSEALEGIDLTKDRLSRLCGAVLLNAQERSPESEFSRYIQYLNDKGVEHTMEKYDWRQKKPTDLSNELYYSARAQGVYRVHSVTNHSCSPNTEVQYTDSNDQSINMVALRDLAEGEEVTISYIDEPQSKDVAYRQKYLLANYRFVCACERCVKEKGAAKGDEQLEEEVMEGEEDEEEGEEE